MRDEIDAGLAIVALGLLQYGQIVEGRQGVCGALCSATFLYVAGPRLSLTVTPEQAADLSVIHRKTG